MIKKARPDVRKSEPQGAILGQKRAKSLEIKQIRAYVEELLALPDEAPMPDWSSLSVADRFAIAVRLIPSDQREALLGKADGHLRRYEKGLDIPLSVVTALAAETEIPLPWIVSGRAMPRKLAIVPGHHDIPAFAEPGAEFIDDVPVQMLALKAAAGRGALMLDDSASHHYFPRAILQSYGVATQHARLMMASGLSMIPTINDGDLMLVDVSPAAAGQIVDGKIYVFALGNEAYVKRLRRSGVKVVMISDNRDMFPPEDAPEEPPMTIYGMVKWAGRGV